MKGIIVPKVINILISFFIIVASVGFCLGPDLPELFMHCLFQCIIHLFP